MNLKDERVDYGKFELLDSQAGDNPLELFSQWFDEARETEAEPNIMIISTSHNNQPQTRVVLLKEVLNGDFIFYTNYNSTKGQALEANPNISILFFWGAQQRQVRIEGTTHKVDSVTSDDYFYSRPKESQIGAIASAQSAPMANREELEQKYAELVEFYKTNPIERPSHWGGYAVKANNFEFWQGRPSRLHDRIAFKKQGTEWTRSRLYP
jgi:pyridoxamine 5'-phosphate oxidase